MKKLKKPFKLIVINYGYPGYIGIITVILSITLLELSFLINKGKEYIPFNYMTPTTLATIIFYSSFFISIIALAYGLIQILRSPKE